MKVTTEEILDRLEEELEQVKRERDLARISRDIACKIAESLAKRELVEKQRYLPKFVS